jgi:hypothetical protein
MKLSTNLLQAAIHCAATKDIRYYLKAVCVDVTSAQSHNIVSTDGYIAFASHDTVETERLPIGQYLLPLEAVKTALRGCKFPTIELQSFGDKFTLGNTVLALVNDKFPDYARVIPSESIERSELVAGYYNPELLVRAHKAVFIATSETGVLFQRGDQSAVITTASGNSMCVVMPLRQFSRDKAGNIKSFNYTGWTK